MRSFTGRSDDKSNVSSRSMKNKHYGYFNATKISRLIIKNSSLTNYSNVSSSANLTRRATKKDISEASLIFKPVELCKFINQSNRFELKQAKKIETNTARTLRKSLVVVDNFISSYVRDNMSDTSALTIQNAWRFYRLKIKWHKYLQKLLFNKHQIIRYVFIGWYGSSVKRYDRVKNAYNRFSSVYCKVEWIKRNKKIVPFALFYPSQRWFISSVVTPRQFLFLTRVLNHTSLRKVFRIWKMISNSMVWYRSHSRSFKFTIRKRHMFGFTYIAFIMWYRITQWKKQSKTKVGCFKLEVSEYIIDWHVREVILNQRRARQIRAEAFYAKRLKNRGVAALHQNIINTKQMSIIMETSRHIYFRNVLKNARRAWSKYISNRKQEMLETLKIKKSWYTYTYTHRRNSAFINIFREFDRKMIIFSVFVRWHKYTRVARLLDITSAFKIFKSPRKIYEVIYKLKGQNDFLMFIRFWKEWIAYVKRRRTWKAFCKKYCNNDYEREYKVRIIFALRRYSLHKLCKKTFPAKRSLFIHELGFSLETMIQDLERLRKQNIKFENLTSGCFSLETLLRSITLYMDSVKGFDKLRLEVKSISRVKPYLQSLNHEKIQEVYKYNVSLLQRVTRNKIIRDTAILKSISSHSMAVELSEYMNGFIPSVSAKVMMEINATEPIIDLDIPDSIFDFLESELEKNKISRLPKPNRLIEDLHKDKMNFNNHMRAPSIIYGRLEIDQEISLQSSNNNKLQDRCNHQSLIKRYKAYENIPKISHDNTKDNNDIKPSMVHFDLYSQVPFDYMKSKLDKCDFMSSLRRFFWAMLETRIMIGKSMDLTNLAPETKHRLRRNIAAFNASICGYDITMAVPMKVDVPPLAEYAVKAVISTHHEIVGQSMYSQYVDEIPFPEKYNIDEQRLLEMRSMVFNKIIAKFPELASDKIGRRMTSDGEDFSHSDALASSFLIPYIFKSNTLRDFLEDEIKIDKFKNKSEDQITKQ